MSVEPLLNKWEVKRLGELSSAIQYGYTAKATTERLGPQLLRITDIQNDAVDWDQVPFCEISAKEKEKYRLAKDDLLFARTGATVGKSYLISGSIPESVFASYLIRVRLLEDVYPKYVAYFFRSVDYWRQITENQAGIGQPNVNGTKLAQIKIPVAPLKQQKLIVAEIEKQFSRLDEAVGNLKRVKAHLKRYKAAVLKAAVEGKLTEDWRKQHPNIEPASKLLERILAERRAKWTGSGNYKQPVAPDVTEIPSLPEGWAWATFEQISSRVTVGHVGPMKHEYILKGVPFLRSQNIRENKFDPEGLRYISREFHAKLSKSVIHTGDLAVVRSGSVGVTCVIPTTLAEANCADLVLIQEPHGLVPQFGAYYMNSLAKRRVAAGKVGVALTHFNTKSVAAMPVPVPPLTEQQLIVAEVERRLSVIEELEAAVQANLTRADRLRQSILQKAFNGKLASEIVPLN